MGKHKIVEGLYDLVVDTETQAELERLAGVYSYHFGEVGPEVLPDLITQQLSRLLQRAFEATPGKTEAERVERQLWLANALVSVLKDQVRSPVGAQDLWPAEARRLMRVAAQGTLGGGSVVRPEISLTSSDLLVNGRREPSVGHEIKREIASADRIDVIVAFLKFSGLRLIRDELAAFAQRRPGRLRVLTTTYVGATEKRAVDALVELGAEVRVSYLAQSTRLHAKAWLFHRESGFSTAYVGSSNLSHSAMVEGMEWNVRLSNVDAGALVEKFQATFEQYWEGGDFEVYESERDGERLLHSLGAIQRQDFDELAGLVDVRPRPHQKQMLEALEAERLRGFTRNLVVAATGTGKTLVSAFDYRRLVQKHGPLTLLFVAHRKEILRQSQVAFRMVMRDGSFGELLVDGAAPSSGRHVFASVQSLHGERLSGLDPAYYDVVVIDEFHHAEAPTYQRVLEHLKPRYLMGLTATPERADGLDVTRWFGGRVATELRLWDALEQNLLAPFQYFGVADDTDLSAVKFSGRTYDPASLANVLTGDRMRARRILQAVSKYVADPGVMRALGFCVSIEHAQLMAATFNAAGLRAEAVHSRTHPEDRANALQSLRNGELQAVFAVDLFNEGLDVPMIDTVLFLRPTESATVFLQQLGRGLRPEDGKECLTVLDFVGNAHKRYRFDQKFRALLGGTRREIADAVEKDFPYLPPGCSIQLERQAREYVLGNLKASLTSDLANLREEMAVFVRQRDFRLKAFLAETGLGLSDVYARPGRSLNELFRKMSSDAWPVADTKDWSGIARLQFVDDFSQVQAWRQIVERSTFELRSYKERLEFMRLLAVAHRSFTQLDQVDVYGKALFSAVGVRREILQVLEVLEDQIRRVSFATHLPDVPLNVHAAYSRNEIMTALGQFKDGRLKEPREGVVWVPEIPADLLFVTLAKSETEYSPKTLYRDYPMTETLFHWESQHTTSAESTTGRRYRTHVEQGSHVLMFARLAKKTSSGFTQPYTFLGPAKYVRHTSERPMQIVWRLDHEMPADLYQQAKVAAG